jgi:hypothetical protein
MSSNPYQAPKAEVVDFEPPAELGDFLGEPRARPAGRGADWVREGWQLFAQAPALWIGMVLVFMGLMMAAAFVPLLGMIAQNLPFPILGAGMAVACDAVRRGQPLEFGHLFVGFSRNTGPLVVVGALYTAAVIVAALIAFVPTIGLVGGMAAMGVGNEADLIAAIGLPLLLGMLILLAITLPLVMAIWFAPALVILNNVPPIEALRLSFRGCLRNIVPFLVYSLIALGLAILATLPLMLGWLVLGPWFYTSNFCAYRDIYYAD